MLDSVLVRLCFSNRVMKVMMTGSQAWMSSGLQLTPPPPVIEIPSDSSEGEGLSMGTSILQCWADAFIKSLRVRLF